MLICSLAALAIGGILTLVGWLMVVAVAFRQGAGWGVGVLLFEPVKWVFVSRYWKHAKNGFVTQMCGWGMLCVAVVLMVVAGAMAASTSPDPQKPAGAQANAAPPTAKPAKVAPAPKQPPAKSTKTVQKSPKRPARQTLSASTDDPQDAPEADPLSAE
jgi:hypothetical protein